MHKIKNSSTKRAFFPNGGISKNIFVGYVECKYDKWNFKPKISPIFHYDQITEVWIVPSWLTPLIHHYDVEEVLGLGQHEQRPFQWPRVSLVTQGAMQIRTQFVRQGSDPTLEQINKHIYGFLNPLFEDFLN